MPTRQNIISFIIIINLLTFPLFSDTGSIPIRGKIIKEYKKLDYIILDIMKKTGYRAITLAITKNGKFLAIRGYGWQDKQFIKPINPHTRMRIASIDKCFGSAATKKLIREGKLKENTKAFKFLKIKPYAKPIEDKKVYDITVGNILNHKLGWDRENDGYSFKVKKAVKRLFKTNKPSFKNYMSYMLTTPLQYTPGSKVCLLKFWFSSFKTYSRKSGKKKILLLS